MIYTVVKTRLIIVEQLSSRNAKGYIGHKLDFSSNSNIILE